MYYSQNDSNSEVKRDQLLQSSLDYWSAAPRPMPDANPFAWEAASRVQVKAGPWVWLVVVIIIALTLFVLTML